MIHPQVDVDMDELAKLLVLDPACVQQVVEVSKALHLPRRQRRHRFGSREAVVVVVVAIVLLLPNLSHKGYGSGQRCEM